MKKNIYFLISCFLLISFGANFLQTAAQTKKAVPIVIELFTAEGCASCPPADKYLQKLIDQQPIAGAEIIALGEHVDYWNQANWTDRFSSAQFSNRQKYYAVFFKRSEIFTPQFIVDGTRETTPKDADKLLTESAKNPKGEIELKAESKDAGTISINLAIANLPEPSAGDKTVAVVAVTESNLTSDVSGGENAGRKLKHTSVTRYLKSIGEIQNMAANFSAEIEIEKDWKRENLSIVAFVQEAGSRRILGAAKVNLK